MKIDRLICKPYPNSTISATFCEIKYISQDRMKLHVWANFSEPIHELWIHSVAYFKFNGLTFSRFPINIWENMCGWLAGKTKSFILDWTFGKVLQYSNLNHPCPYDGHVYVKVDNLSATILQIEQFLPAGKFRLDMNITDGNRNRVLAMAKIIFTIFDNRIERF